MLAAINSTRLRPSSIEIGIRGLDGNLTQEIRNVEG
jgi:hypothetical protein